MRKPKLIVHDWDDVVTNSFDAYSKFYFDFADYFGLSRPTLDGIRKYWGGTIPEIAHGQWPDMRKERVEQLIKDFIHHQEIRKALTVYETAVFPGVVQTFKELSKKYPLAILSSGYKPRLVDIYKKAIHPDIAYHKAILAPPELTVTKPDPRVFDVVLEAIGDTSISNDEIVYIGDALVDLQVARNRGVEFYAVTTGIHTKSDFLQHGLAEPNILNRFSDILQILP